MAAEVEIPLKVKVCCIGITDTLINGWFLVDTIKFVYETFEWMLWKFANRTPYYTSPSSSSLNLNDISQIELVSLTVHDRQRFLWLFLDSVFALMLILIVAGAVGLTASTCLKPSPCTFRLIRFWIRCNILVVTIATVTFAVRVMTTTFYNFAPIIILIIGGYLCVRYKCVDISREYQHQLRTTTTTSVISSDELSTLSY